jgi:transcription factor SPN1
MENDIFGSDDDEKKGGDLIQDIFGSDDDDDQDLPAAASSHKASASASMVDHDDDGWDDSDDDQPKNASRLQKSSKLLKKSSKPTAADIFGSDDDDDDDFPRQQQRSKEVRKRKKSRDNKSKLSKKSRGLDGEKVDKGDSGDEYDSGEEIVKTKEDDAFIDEDDDQAYLVREYDEDRQDFNDDRPDAYKRPLKSKSSSSSSSQKKSSSDSRKVDSKADDPLSETIRSMKKQKETPLSQSEKESFVKDLMHRMSLAAAKDEDLASQGQPATNKLQMLDGVKKALALQVLQETLLDNDVLSRLKEWIEPKQDAERSLPSLTVRTAVYEMLLSLPCYAEHLKRSGIGATIVTLRKHKNETIPNKKMLKEIVEKWCRPLFGKSVDQRSRDMDYNEELRVAAARQKFVSTIREDRVAFDTVLGTGTAADQRAAADAKARVRTPYNNGYVFTVRPEQKSVEKRDLQRERMGESRMNLMKITRVSKGGVKDNFRAVQVDLSGRDKA